MQAARVAALDHFVWALDLPRAVDYWRECKERDVIPRPLEKTDLWPPDKLGFDTAHRALRSKVEVVVDDFMTMNCESFGAFDVTFWVFFITCKTRWVH